MSAQRKTLRLSDIADITSGRYVRDYVQPGGNSAAYVRVDNVRPYGANLNPGDVAHVRRDDPTIPRSARIGLGDVVIARTGTLGKAMLAGRSLEGAIASQHVTRLTVRAESQVPAPVLCAFLNDGLGRRQLLAGGSGSTRLELTHDRLGELRVPVFTGSRVDQVRSLIDSGASDLEKSGDLFRSAVRVFDDYLRPPSSIEPPGGWCWRNPESIASSWVPRYHLSSMHEWTTWARSVFELRRLGDLAHIRRGKGTRVNQYADSGVPFVRTSSLINGGIDPFPDYYADPQTVKSFGQPTPSGTILLSIEGKIGEVALLTAVDECAVKNHIELIQAGQDELAERIFLTLASRLGSAQLRAFTVVQATLPGLANRSREVLVPTRMLAGNKKRASLAERAVSVLREACRARVQGIEALREGSALLREELQR